MLYPPLHGASLYQHPFSWTLESRLSRADPRRRLASPCRSLGRPRTANQSRAELCCGVRIIGRAQRQDRTGQNKQDKKNKQSSAVHAYRTFIGLEDVLGVHMISKIRPRSYCTAYARSLDLSARPQSQHAHICTGMLNDLQRADQKHSKVRDQHYRCTTIQHCLVCRGAKGKMLLVQSDG